MEFKYKNWNEITIDLYYEILEVFEDESLSEAEKDLAVCAILCDVPEEEIYSLSILEASKLVNGLSWLSKYDFNKKYKGGKMQIDGEEYRVNCDLQKMTIAQYIDFQTFYRMRDLKNTFGNILACFIIPDGKKYGEDYDIAELAKKITGKISIVTANEILFFFLKELGTSIRALQIYLDFQIWRMKRKADSKQKLKIKELQERIQEMNQILMAGFV